MFSIVYTEIKATDFIDKIQSGRIIEKIKNAGIEEIDKQFDDNQSIWPKLNPQYLTQKILSGKSRKILEKTGKMRTDYLKSFKLTSRRYTQNFPSSIAKAHQFGIKVKKREFDIFKIENAMLNAALNEADEIAKEI